MGVPMVQPQVEVLKVQAEAMAEGAEEVLQVAEGEMEERVPHSPMVVQEVMAAVEEAISETRTNKLAMAVLEAEAADVAIKTAAMAVLAAAAEPVETMALEEMEVLAVVEVQQKVPLQGQGVKEAKMQAILYLKVVQVVRWEAASLSTQMEAVL